MDTVDRIFEILDRLPMEQREFAKLVGVSDDTASDWRRRRSASYTKRLAKISEVLGTSVEYLLTGEKSPPPLRRMGTSWTVTPSWRHSWVGTWI